MHSRPWHYGQRHSSVGLKGMSPYYSLDRWLGLPLSYSDSSYVIICVTKVKPP